MLPYAFSSETSIIFREYTVAEVQIGVWMFMALAMELVLHLTQFNNLTTPHFRESPWLSASLVNWVALFLGIVFLAVFPAAMYGFLSMRQSFIVPFVVFCGTSALVSIAGIALNIPEVIDQFHTSWYHLVYFSSTSFVHAFAFIVAIIFAEFARKLDTWIKDEGDLKDLERRFEETRKKALMRKPKGYTK